MSDTGPSEPLQTSVGPNQKAPVGALWSGPALFVRKSLYAKTWLE